jgi:hypothetical protein
MATLTINHYINEANSFITDIRNNRNGYYLFAARSLPWANSSGGTDDTAVLATNNSVAQVEQTVYDDLLFGKLLADDDVSFVVPRIDWAANTVYAAYNQNDANLYSKEFYVVTDSFEVYKCIDNNNGANSTVKPSLTSTSGIFKTGDDYIWKYMYTIDPASNNKFTTSTFVPVVPNAAVQGNATPGSIDVIKLTNGGSGYEVYETGYIGGVVNKFVIQLPPTSSNTDDYYTGSSIYLKSGFGSGQIREISSSNGTSKQIIVEEPFETYARLDLANIQGTVATGYFVEQPYDDINYLRAQGYFNINTTVAQSDTGTVGRILAANTSVLQVSRNVSNTTFSLGLPIVDTAFSGILEPGTVSVGNTGACNIAFVTSAGSGYTANATVTITANGSGTGAVANAQANASGKISAINITTPGSSYFVAPTLTIAAPTAQTFNANTAVTAGAGAGANNVIALATANRFVINDLITYTVSPGNTAISGLVSGTSYFVEFANATVVALKTTLTGSRISLTKGPTETGHTLQGQTATAVMFCDNQIVRGSGTRLNDAPFNINANTAGVSNTADTLLISGANSFISVGDRVYYGVPAGNTAIPNLIGNTFYFVTFANASAIALSASLGGANINIAETRTAASPEVHTITGNTAGYANGDYIRVGANTTSNIRRVANNVNTTVVIVEQPFNTSFTATGPIATLTFSGGTALGYNNNDIITIRSSNAFINATATMTTNATGGSLTLTVTNTGSGFLLGRVPVANISITNSSGGTAAGNTIATFFVANVTSANSHFKMPIAAEPVSIVIQGANGYVSNTNLSSVQIAITNNQLSGTFFTVGEKVNMTNSGRVNQGANGIIAYANTSTVILSSVLGSWQSNSGGTQFFVSGESSQQLSQIVLVTGNPNITLNEPVGTFKLGYPVTFRTIAGAPPSGNAILVATISLPNDQTEYQIGPTVTIQGDGGDAAAIAVVNNASNSSYEIVSIDVINPGSGYTEARVFITANTLYGTNATANAIISPVFGHGYDPVTELGARYVGINGLFDELSNENYKFPGYGKYRKVGILENPQFKDLTVTLKDFDRANFTLNAASYSSTLDWEPGEVVVQSSTNAAGVVVVGNTSYLQLKNVKGTFNVANSLYGFFSNTTANVTSVDVIRFPVGNSAAIVTQANSGAIGIITSSVNNTVYMMSNVVGQFADGDVIYDNVVNAYATVESIFTANNTVDSSIDFGNKFNQTARITLTSENGLFVDNEVVVQNVTNARGTIVSASQEKDLVISNTSGSFAVGDVITDETTNANGICVFANSTYLKLTSVSQDTEFSGIPNPHNINNGSGATATIDQVLTVLVLNNVFDETNFQAGNNEIVGQFFNGVATCNSHLLIRNPDLVRDTGKVIYLESFAPVERSPTSKEEVKLVIKF